VIAVILAAGRGHRLSPITGDEPKCLARIGSRTLLTRQIDLLRDAGVGSVTVVAGYSAAAVAREAGERATIVCNPKHATTNSLYSLWLARHLLRGGFIVLNCDVLCHPQLLTDLLTCRHEDALLYSPHLPSEVYTDEEMKLVVRKGRVVRLSKALDANEADGENVGIARFGAEGASFLVDQLCRHVEGGDERAWLPAALTSFAARRPLWAVPTRGFPWIEIDSPDDYRRACDEILPVVEAAVRRTVHHV